MASLMSSTTLPTSRPLTFADTTSLRCTFSLLIAPGPVVETISATSSSGTLLPNPVSISTLPIASALPVYLSSSFSTTS